MVEASVRERLSCWRPKRARDSLRGQRRLGEMEARRKSSVLAWIIILLEAPRQRLQVCEGDLETNLSIIIRIARLGQGILSIHDLKNRGFSRLIAQSGETQTVGGEFRSLT